MESERNAPVRLRPEVAGAGAYKQGVKAPADGFKLSSNENPFEPLPSVVERVNAVTDLNRYGDAALAPLRERIAASFAVTSDEVHIASGSVAILYQLVHAAAGVGDEYIHAWPSFEAYPALGLSSGATAVPIALKPDQTHDLDAMLDAVTDRTRVIILCSPNNPTGPAITRDGFTDFMKRVPRDVLVILDEAYREFVTAEDAVFGERELHSYPQLVVLRTFSKAYGLAALRIGYAVGDARILAAAKAVSIPLSVTWLAHEGAMASLDAETELLARIDELTTRRDSFAESLRTLGFDVPDAQGNFVWLNLGAAAQAFAELCASEGIIVRPFPGLGVRMSVGEPESIPLVLDLASRFSVELPERREEVR